MLYATVLNWKLEVKWKHWQQASVPVFVPRRIPSSFDYKKKPPSRSVYQIPSGSAGVKLLGSTVSFCLSFSDFSPQFCCASLISDFPSNPASLPDYSFLPTTSDWESHKPTTTVWLEEGACTRRWREVPCFNCILRFFRCLPALRLLSLLMRLHLRVSPALVYLRLPCVCKSLSSPQSFPPAVVPLHSDPCTRKYPLHIQYTSVFQPPCHGSLVYRQVCREQLPNFT